MSENINDDFELAKQQAAENLKKAAKLIEEAANLVGEHNECLANLVYFGKLEEENLFSALNKCGWRTSSLER